MIFDLWDTLVRWDDRFADASLELVAAALGRPKEEARTAWQAGHVARGTGPMLDYLQSLGLARGDAAALTERRRELMRGVFVPVEGALETLRELRARGLRLGLLSVCSDDVPAVWPDTAFAGLFDAEVFSCDVGMLKPDPRVYALTCERLGVDPQETLFVGDGANDELAGAERSRLRAVQVGAAYEWRGPRIGSIPEVLELVQPAGRPVSGRS